MRDLKGKEDKESKEKLTKTIEALPEAAENKYKIVVDELKKMKPN